MKKMPTIPQALAIAASNHRKFKASMSADRIRNALKIITRYSASTIGVSFSTGRPFRIGLIGRQGQAITSQPVQRIGRLSRTVQALT